MADLSSFINISANTVNSGNNITTQSDVSAVGNVYGANFSATGNISASTFYVGNTPFTRTLTVGRAVSPVTVPLASNNSFNVLLSDGSGNVVVYTT